MSTAGRLADWRCVDVLITFAMICMTFSSCGRPRSSAKKSQPQAERKQSQSKDTVSVEPKAKSDSHERDAVSKPSIQVLSPNGNEEIQVGKPFSVTWSSQGLGDSRLLIKAHGGDDKNPGGWYPLAENVSNTGSHMCTLRSVGWKKYKIHISTTDGKVTDASDDYFAIKLPQLERTKFPPPQPPSEDEKETVAALRSAGVGVRIDLATGKAISVSFKDAQISDATMALIEKLVGLESLVLTNSRLGDEGLKHISELTKLKGLRLRGTDVTDDGLKHLEGLTNLISLDLQETDVTKAALQRLANRLPKCFIVADDFRYEGSR